MVVENILIKMVVEYLLINIGRVNHLNKNGCGEYLNKDCRGKTLIKMVVEIS